MAATIEASGAARGEKAIDRRETNHPLLAYAMVATLLAAGLATALAGPTVGGLVATAMIPVLVLVVFIDPGGNSPSTLAERVHYAG